MREKHHYLDVKWRLPNSCRRLLLRFSFHLHQQMPRILETSCYFLSLSFLFFSFPNWDSLSHNPKKKTKKKLMGPKTSLDLFCMGLGLMMINSILTKWYLRRYLWLFIPTHESTFMYAYIPKKKKQNYEVEINS